MKIRLAFIWPLVLLAGGCTSADRQLQVFVSGDIANAEAIATEANLIVLTDCLKQLEPVAMASPAPVNDGLFVLAVRAEALQAAVRGACGPVLAPLLVRAIGKATGPFGLFLPF